MVGWYDFIPSFQPLEWQPDHYGVRMSGYLYLAIAITAEVIATTPMKALDGFVKPRRCY
jgi:hypothetical protein